jgi:NAD(P)-dependent dehydrogenase (short-subunit alcohol dehydrogenase family)
MKTALVTGASAGIGLEIAKGLARSGHHVLMISRDPSRSASAAGIVRSVAKDGAVISAIAADLSSLAEVRRAAAEARGLAPKLDVLVSCAAIVPREREVTADGLESAFATNVVAPLVLVHELEGPLAAAAPSRVVSFYGGNHRTIDFDDLQSAKGRYNGWNAYGQSKLCVALLTIEMARRLGASGITVTCAWPGIVNTEGIRGLRGSIGFMTLLMRPLMKTPEQGAATALWLATAPDLERTRGKVYGAMFGDPTRELTVPPVAKDPEAARRLYEICERLGGITA